MINHLIALPLRISMECEWQSCKIIFVWRHLWDPWQRMMMTDDNDGWQWQVTMKGDDNDGWQLHLLRGGRQFDRRPQEPVASLSHPRKPHPPALGAVQGGIQLKCQAENNICLRFTSHWLLLVSEVEAQQGNNDDHSKEKNLQGGSLIKKIFLLYFILWMPRKLISWISQKLTFWMPQKVIFWISQNLTIPTMNIGLLVTSEERAPCPSLCNIMLKRKFEFHRIKWDVCVFCVWY